MVWPYFYTQVKYKSRKQLKVQILIVQLFLFYGLICHFETVRTTLSQERLVFIYFLFVTIGLMNVAHRPDILQNYHLIFGYIVGIF